MGKLHEKLEDNFLRLKILGEISPSKSFIILIPDIFHWNEATLEENYFCSKRVKTDPVAVLTSLRSLLIFFAPNSKEDFFEKNDFFRRNKISRQRFYFYRNVMISFSLQISSSSIVCNCCCCCCCCCSCCSCWNGYQFHQLQAGWKLGHH